MRFYINYVVLCEQGKIRTNNQDNFWCLGSYLQSENSGLGTPIVGRMDNKGSPAFAVFDGMGGEKHGEVAAYLAAKSFDSFCTETPRHPIRQFLPGICRRMNAEICSYAKNSHSAHMGTTAAIIVFGRKEIYVCNVGDSKVFRHCSEALTQISRDHTAAALAPAGRKPPLTQHLGIPEDDFIIAPYMAIGEYADGDRYLICSDGLSDMVPFGEIESVLTNTRDTFEAAAILMETAMSNGGNDNATIILCDIRKKDILNRAKKS